MSKLDRKATFRGRGCVSASPPKRIIARKGNLSIVRRDIASSRTPTSYHHNSAGGPHGTIPEYSRDGRPYAGRQDQSARAQIREPVRQDRSLQSAGLGEGPAGARRDRGGREIRRAEARPDRHRGDQRQHRHRPCDGVRRQGLSAGRHHGGDLQRRAAQADALSRRQGRCDAGGRARRRHDQQDDRARQDAWLVHDPAVRERSQPRLSIRAPPRARSSTISPASSWTTG